MTAATQPGTPTSRAGRISERANVFWMLRAAGFTEEQARELARSRDTVFLVPLTGGAR